MKNQHTRKVTKNTKGVSYNRKKKKKMCKEQDEVLPPRTPKGLPPPAEKPIKPEDVIPQPVHTSTLAAQPNPLEGVKQFEDVPLSDITDSAA